MNPAARKWSIVIDMARDDSNAARLAATAGVSRGWTGAATCAIAFHLAAVFIAPFAIPPSDLSLVLRAWFRPYIEINHLDHGYKFFDEPGPSHRIRYRIELAAGGPIEGTIPDREVHWPRLLYHRHFMLAEQHRQFYVGDDAGQLSRERDPRSYDAWAAEKRRYDVYTRSYCQHLLRKYADQGALRVTLFGLIRGLPTPDDVRAGRFPGPVESRELITYPPREK